jgi:hypothetical protein
MDIAKALAERTQELEEEQARVLETHRLKLASLKEAEDKARVERDNKAKAKRAEQEQQMRDQKAAQDAQRVKETTAKANEDAEYSRRQFAIEEEAKQMRELDLRRSELELIEAKAEQLRKDSEALLAEKVDTERIMPHPLQRFLQTAPE